MATTISGLSEAQLDDQMIAAIQANVPLLDAFSTVLTGDGPGLVKGNSYIVPVVGNLTAGEKTPGEFAPAGGSLTGVSVAVSNFAGVSWEVAEGAIDGALIGRFMAAQIDNGVRTVAQKIVDAALATLTASNFAASVEVDLSAFSLADLAAIRAAAKTLLKGSEGAAVVNSYLASQALTLQPVVMAQAVADGKNAIATGAALPTNLFGYRAFEYSDFPAANGIGAVIGKGAIAVAAGAPSQAVVSGGFDGYRRIVTDPESGLGIQYSEHVSVGGRIVGEVCALYGVAKAQDAAVRIVAAA